MPIHWSHPRYRGLFLFAVTLGLLLLGYYLREIVNPLLLAFLLSYILNPVVEFLGKRGISRQAGVIILFLSIFLSAALGVSLFGLKVYHNFTDIRVTLLGEPVISKADLGKDANHVGLRIPDKKRNKESNDKGKGAEARDDSGKKPKKDTDKEKASGKADDSKGKKEAPEEERPANAAERPPRYFRDLNGDGVWQLGLVQKFNDRIEPYLSELSEKDMDKVTTLLQDSAGKAADFVIDGLEGAQEYASSIWNLLNYLLLVPVYSFFILMNFSSIKRNLGRHLPKRYRSNLIDLASEIDRSVSAFFRGRLFIALIKGVITGVGLSIISVPFGLTIGMIAGLLSFVPALGPVFALVFGFLLGVGAAPSVLMLIIGISVVLAIAEAVETLCFPIVLGKEMGLHPVALILAFLVFGRLFGLFGILLAVPIASVCKILFFRYVLPEIQEIAGIEPLLVAEGGSEPNDSVGQREVDDEGEDVVESGDEGASGQGGVDLEAVASKGNESSEQGGVDNTSGHANADDNAKLDVLKEGGGEEGKAAADGSHE